MLTIEVQPHPIYFDRFQIFLDGEKWKEIHRSIFGKKPQFAKNYAKEDWDNYFHSLELKRVKAYLLWRLSSQAYHSDQLKVLLNKRLVSQDLIETVIQDFKQKEWLNDDQWLASFIQSHRKRLGLKAIIQKLRQKGISQEQLNSLCMEEIPLNDETESIQHLLNTRYRNKDLSNFKEKQKVIASLLRKGFDYSTIQKILKI